MAQNRHVLVGAVAQNHCQTCYLENDFQAQVRCAYPKRPAHAIRAEQAHLVGAVLLRSTFDRLVGLGSEFGLQNKCALQSRPSMWFLAQNRHIWLVPLRSTVGEAPDHSPRKPSSLTIVAAQWMGPCTEKADFDFDDDEAAVQSRVD